jgi:hypothetical protein
MKRDKYLNVISVLEVLDTGDRPIKVLAEDENAYLIKHNIKGHVIRNLICEYLAYKLFKYFDVSIPNAEILTFKPELFHHELKGLTGRFKQHEVFASRWLNARDDIKDDLYINKENIDIIDNLDDLAKILVMDLWLKNSDRQPLNLNLIVSNQKIFAIDHSAIFDHNSFSILANQTIKEYFVEPGEQGDLLINSHYFNSFLKLHSNKLFASGINLCDKIISSDSALITKILDSLPDSWEIYDLEKKSITDYLDFRKKRLLDVFTGHFDFSRK